jgi:hypothetical protein
MDGFCYNLYVDDKGFELEVEMAKFKGGELILLRHEDRNGHTCGEVVTDKSDPRYVQACKNFKEQYGVEFEGRLNVGVCGEDGGDIYLIRDYSMPNGVLVPAYADELASTGGWQYNDANALIWFTDGAMNVAPVVWDEELHNSLEALREKLVQVDELGRVAGDQLVFRGFTDKEHKAIEFVCDVMLTGITSGLKDIATEIRSHAV